MKMTKLTMAMLAGGLMMGAVNASAEEAAATSAFTTSGNFSVTTDYLYRGISQTSGAPAIQGTLTLSHESGFYASVWGSSISFASGLELDPSIGFAGKAGDVGYDVGVLRYGYPHSTAAEGGGGEFDFTELYASVSFSGAKLGLAYTDEFFGETGESLYVYADYGTEIGAGFGVVAHVGLNMLDDQYYGPVADGLMLDEDSYVDYKLGVNKAMQGVTVEVAYMGSNLDDEIVPDGEGTFVATVTKAF